MNVLFLSYWEASDGLSKATVIPHLKILQGMPQIERILYCSIERTKKKVGKLDIGTHVSHLPLYSGKSYFHKIIDFIVLPRTIARLIDAHGIDMMICRGAPAGSLGHLVHKYLRTPYVVESFEPHAQYMVESGVWRRHGLKYIFQRRWEKAQLQTARWIVTVSHSYRNHLVRSGVPEKKILVAPCGVDVRKFAFNSKSRIKIRGDLGFTDSCIVGIYVGKFGGLYYDEEAFEIFSMAFQNIRGFKLVILTPDNPELVGQKLETAGVAKRHYHVAHVDHDAVPGYLSSADMAFALYKPSPSKRYLSPIKVGEYWANGLPLILTEGVGDDSAIIKQEGGGVTFSYTETGSALEALRSVETLVRENNRLELSERISKLAGNHRNLNRVRQVYESIFFAR